jgi:hypothetical protein
MKRFALFLALLILGTSPAIAAPKSVAAKKLTIIATVNAESMVISGKTIITISNSDGLNSNILLTGMDISGAQQWQKTIDSGVDEIALASAVDPLGNVWLAGASSAIPVVESATAPVQAENPDGVVAEPVTKLRGDMNQLTLWKLSPLGDLLGIYTLSQSAPALISAVSVNASGVSIVGQLLDKPFVVSATSNGVFGKVISIGTSKTVLGAIVRHSDGSVSVFGSSAETLGGKKLAGVRDGVLIRVSKTGAIASVVRSSAPKANRAWLAADSTLALTGFVKSGKIVETAFTKFTMAFAPTWTMRVPSLGTSTVLTAGNTTYGAISSSAAVPGVIGWKPTSASVLLLTLDGKGVVSGAYGSSEIAEPISMTYSKELGVVGLAKTAAQTLSLFKLA